MDEWLGRQRLLVLAPHPDDETFGCGGTIAKAKALGGEVFVVVASVGDLNHYDPNFPYVSAEARLRELADAMRVLNVDDYDILYVDSEVHLRLDAIPRRDLIAKIERDGRLAIDRIKPTVVILPEVSFNQDHEALFKAGFTACRPHLISSKHVPRIVLSCDCPQLTWNTHAVMPNFYVDISDFLHLKLKAHACHKSQQRLDPHHASLENLERLARLRGSAISVAAAEGFFCHRMMV